MALDDSARGDGTPPTLAGMLRYLADRGWRPLLYADSDRLWVCFPQGEVRAWASFRSPDPIGAARQLYEFALQHPNEAPRFAAPAGVPFGPSQPTVSPPDDGRKGIVTPEAAHVQDAAPGISWARPWSWL